LTDTTKRRNTPARSSLRAPENTPLVGTVIEAGYPPMIETTNQSARIMF